MKRLNLGLSGRASLDEGRGMLFAMPKDDYQRFWMKGMQFPIDIVWIENSRAIGCEERTLPGDQRIFTSPGKASLVLETSAGFCEKYQVQVNDLVEVQ